MQENSAEEKDVHHQMMLDFIIITYRQLRVFETVEFKTFEFVNSV